MLLPFATEAELPAAAPAAVELDPKMTVVELVLVELDPQTTVIALVVVVLVAVELVVVVLVAVELL